MNVKQFVPSAVCLSCDGCCRFKEEQSPWRPKITEDEIARKGKRDLLSEIYSKDKIDASGHIKTTCSAGHHFCSFFSPQDNTCGVYDVRPFECELYPFVLTKKDGKTIIAAHHNCPFIQMQRNAAEFEAYAAYLKEFFAQKDVLDFLKKNPTLVGEYSNYEEELEYLFTVG